MKRKLHVEEELVEYKFECVCLFFWNFAGFKSEDGVDRDNIFDDVIY